MTHSIIFFLHSTYDFSIDTFSFSSTPSYPISLHFKTDIYIKNNTVLCTMYRILKGKIGENSHVTSP